MQINSSTRFAAIAALVGALACAGNTAREADTDETAAARDTTTADTLGGQEQNPPGYRGMETDTSMTPNQQPTDTFLQNQGTGQAQDTSGYSGMERARMSPIRPQPVRSSPLVTPRATTSHTSRPIRPPPASTAGRLRVPGSGAPMGAPEFFSAFERVSRL